jgi:hypothetical protein
LVRITREFQNTLTPADRSTLVNGIDPQHSYNTLSAGTKIEFNDGFQKSYNQVVLQIISSQLRIVFYIKPSLQFNVMDQFIKTNIIVDYVGGTFEKIIKIIMYNL